MREILQDNNALRAGVFELVFEFPRRIQGVDVDDNQAGPENAAHDDGVLQNIRQHDGDAFAASQAQRLLQVARELHGQAVEFSVAECRAHVRISRTAGIIGEGLLKQITDGKKRWFGALFRNPRRI